MSGIEGAALSGKADVAAAYVKGDARSEEHELMKLRPFVGRFSMATSFTAELT